MTLAADVSWLSRRRYSYLATRRRRALTQAHGQAPELDAEIAASQAALEAAGHRGEPNLVFDGEPFFGQDRIDLAVWRMEQKGLTRR